MENNDDAFKNAKIKFPVDLNFKVILNDTFPDQVNIVHIANAIEDAGLDYGQITSKESTKKNYTSYTFRITVDNEVQFKDLYEKVKTVPGFVMAF